MALAQVPGLCVRKAAEGLGSNTGQTSILSLNTSQCISLLNISWMPPPCPLHTSLQPATFISYLCCWPPASGPAGVAIRRAFKPESCPLPPPYFPTACKTKSTCPSLAPKDFGHVAPSRPLFC
ncbi:hypothetical protein CB1_000985017 [Camelus ferus]|nr:hypothetical protein CB1_000985017 [Camelus ferus]